MTRLEHSYLERPYARLILPESNGTFRGEILEFSGCYATGDTAEETLSALEKAAAAWIEAALSQGQSIPDPIDVTEFSGRLMLRFPKSLHKKATQIAERDGVSLNQFIVSAVSEQVGGRTSFMRLATIAQNLYPLTLYELPSGWSVKAIQSVGTSLTHQVNVPWKVLQES